MKRIRIKNGVVTFLCAAVFAGLTACDTDPVERNGGKLPDKDDLENTHGFLRSSNASGNEMQVLLTEGSGGYVTDLLYYQLSKPVSGGMSLNARIDQTLLDQYNALHETDFKLLPEANYDFPDGKTLEIASDGQKSGVRRIRFISDGLAAGEYLLPVTILVAEAEPGNEWQTVYYKVDVREPQVGEFELNADQVFMVCYINTNVYDPRLVDDYYVQKNKVSPPELAWYRTIGNIVNLRTVVIDYDAMTGRALLKLGADMRYVLGHAVTYIRPLQDKGRKVCLCLEGGGTGLGFCNLSDAQITDFVAQVKVVVDEFGLDGINLWDKNTGYGKESMPAMNTTSYPKLVKALREALGAEKLLTLTDHMEPTEYFWDTVATGGIEVGQYLDYAWSGYCDNEMKVQIVDPYHQGADNVSTDFPRKPIAGLDATKYGCINIPWYTQTSPNQGSGNMKHIFSWRQAGNKQSQILLFEDLRTNLQDNYEGSWQSSIDAGYGIFADDGLVSSFELFPGFWIDTFDNNYMLDIGKLGKEDGNRYNKWLKDW